MPAACTVNSLKEPRNPPAVLEVVSQMLPPAAAAAAVAAAAGGGGRSRPGLNQHLLYRLQLLGLARMSFRLLLTLPLGVLKLPLEWEQQGLRLLPPLLLVRPELQRLAAAALPAGQLRLLRCVPLVPAQHCQGVACQQQDPGLVVLRLLLQRARPAAAGHALPQLLLRLAGQLLRGYPA